MENGEIPSSSTTNSQERPLNKKLSFERKELDATLNQTPFDPNNLIGLFERDYSQEYATSVGVWEGYTLKQHTSMVLSQFEKYFSNSLQYTNIDKNFFKTFLALHDLGKPEAVRMGEKHLQYEHTKRIMNNILSELGYSRQEKALALALVSADPIGESIKANGRNIEASAREIIKLAQAANIPTAKFFDLLTIYYRVDAGSYTEDAGGKRSLDILFEFDKERKQLRFAPQTNEVIAKLKTAVESLSNSASNDRETSSVKEKEPWMLTKKEFQNNFYLCVMPEEDAVKARNIGAITHGSFFLSRNNDNIEKARKAGNPNSKASVFFIVKAESLPYDKTIPADFHTPSNHPADIVVLGRQEKVDIHQATEAPAGVDPHKYLVYEALRNGKSVPQEVLADYPYLALTKNSTFEEIVAAVKTAFVKKEPWELTRDEFAENFYLHGTTEPKTQLIRHAGGIQKGSFINVAQDWEKTAAAYATDAPRGSYFSKAGRGTEKGTIFVTHITDLLTQEDMANSVKEFINDNNLYFYKPPASRHEFSYHGKTIPYVAEVPPDADPHTYLVNKALAEGKPVPTHVLDDYLELATFQQKDKFENPQRFRFKYLRQRLRNILDTLRKSREGKKKFLTYL